MKILCVLYDDPKGGMPKSYPLSDLPKLEKYPDGMTLPSPKGRDFTPGQLLGCVSGELGLRKFLEGNVIPSGYFSSFGKSLNGYDFGIPPFGSSYKTHKIFIFFSY